MVVGQHIQFDLLVTGMVQEGEIFGATLVQNANMSF